MAAGLAVAVLVFAVSSVLPQRETREADALLVRPGVTVLSTLAMIVCPGRTRQRRAMRGECTPRAGSLFNPGTKAFIEVERARSRRVATGVRADAPHTRMIAITEER